MGERMVRIRDADLGIGTAADLSSKHEGADACQIGLVRERQEVHKELCVCGVVVRDSRRLVDKRQLARALLLRSLDAPLDVAHRVEELGDLRPVAGPEVELQTMKLRTDGI